MCNPSGTQTRTREWCGPPNASRTVGRNGLLALPPLVGASAGICQQAQGIRPWTCSTPSVLPTFLDSQFLEFLLQVNDTLVEARGSEGMKGKKGIHDCHDIPEGQRSTDMKHRLLEGNQTSYPNQPPPRFPTLSRQIRVRLVRRLLHEYRFFHTLVLPSGLSSVRQRKAVIALWLLGWCVAEHNHYQRRNQASNGEQTRRTDQVCWCTVLDQKIASGNQ